MKQNLTNKIILVFFLILITSVNTYSKSYIKKNTIEFDNYNKISISETAEKRIKNYLNGKINSKNLQQNFKNVSGIYFAISDNGSDTSISFCNELDFDLCAEQHLAFQTLKKCEKISKRSCFLLFRGKTFLPTREKKININNFFTVSNKQLGNHYDIQGWTLEEINDPEEN